MTLNCYTYELADTLGFEAVEHVNFLELGDKNFSQQIAEQIIALANNIWPAIKKNYGDENSSVVLEYSEQGILEKAEPETRDAYALIKKQIYEISPGVEARFKKSMICFYAQGKGLVWIKPLKNRITMWLRKGSYLDINYKPIPEGWGSYPELHFESSDINIQYIKRLLEEAYALHKGCIPN